MQARILQSLEDVDPQQWNALVRDDHPFLLHEFLIALERNDCLGPRTGWYPRHVAVEDSRGALVGATPMYAKTNSWGEFVFDWSWAHAYQRHGVAYYPKLVAAVPFTPVVGQRLLVRPDRNYDEVAGSAVQAAVDHARAESYSSIHWLFPIDSDMRTLQNHGLLQRLDCQFHWRNEGYANFEDFLSTLSAKKRKNIRRDRRQVQEAGIRLETLPGAAVDGHQWKGIYDLYRSTFELRGRPAPLTLEFFLELATSMGDRLVVVVAYRRRAMLAAAISFRSDRSLYGRHWGCDSAYSGLHFEACYYRGIEYCIENGLQTFEPGAQGEHKVSRGFLPVYTHSGHWIAHEGFRKAVHEFLRVETPAVSEYAKAVQAHSPYRQSDAGRP